MLVGGVAVGRLQLFAEECQVQPPAPPSPMAGNSPPAHHHQSTTPDLLRALALQSLD